MIYKVIYTLYIKAKNIDQLKRYILEEVGYDRLKNVKYKQIKYKVNSINVDLTNDKTIINCKER